MKCTLEPTERHLTFTLPAPEVHLSTEGDMRKEGAAQLCVKRKVTKINHVYVRFQIAH